ncbi:histidine kinase [Pedobacter sp. KR3-3]|uniref:Histidine kinase n=1 Tax=Pedobacter albus TaxID=3113905 RepID=A0ABU7I7A3_9SPHI|nr:histidine kinase [Pedobacter sp. KR3-3]MEE1945358.1 histidine kinase [Pedobacter sp. KR3-3]
MKNISLLILLLSSMLAFGQQKTVDSAAESKYFEFAGNQLVDVRKATPAQLQLIARKKRLVAISKDHFLFSVGENLGPAFQTMALRFQQNTSATVYEGLDWSWSGRNSLRRYLLDKEASIEFADVSITPANAKDYRYHVVTNDDTEIVGWTIPNNFKTTSDGQYTYAYFGSYAAQPNGYIRIELYNVRNYKKRDGIMVDWRAVKPLGISVGLEYSDKDFPIGLLYKSIDERTPSGKAKEPKNGLHQFYLADSLVRLHVLPENYTYNFDFKIELIRNIDGKTERLDLGTNNKFFFIYKEYWKQPGQYELILTPKLPRPGGTPVVYLKDKAVSYRFEVLPDQNPKRLFSSKQIALFGLLLCAVLGGIFGAVVTKLKKKNQQRVQDEQQQKELAKTQLASVRAQLNPHFMFNALAGIQNLMNKQQLEEANHYLNKFARLTRNVLDNKEQVSLAEEQALLTDYLEMEQQRFGFSFELKVSPGLDIHNIEIPAMLLQPFVENAVKHGIATKEKAGHIAVAFEQREKDLVLTVSDNGLGFDTTKNYEGLGLQLSKNRISLLNAIYQDSPLYLTMEANDKGTMITITLTQWL